MRKKPAAREGIFLLPDLFIFFFYQTGSHNWMLLLPVLTRLIMDMKQPLL